MASKTNARNRALHAARAVTLGLVVSAGSSGCFGTHERGPGDREPEPDSGPPPDDAAVADAGWDAGTDAGRDAGTDAGRDQCDMTEGWEAYQDCCDLHMWDPAWGCFAWGPFVPPAEVL